MDITLLPLLPCHDNHARPTVFASEKQISYVQTSFCLLGWVCCMPPPSNPRLDGRRIYIGFAK